jgi:SAM-dependent MidA family methyltransferase
MSVLREIIYRRIEANPQKRITFAEYMDLVLYHPQQGYYATEAVNIGKQGDFITSPHWGPDFGELLAEQLREIWQILEFPRPFTVVEMGAGQGILAANILSYLQRQDEELWEVLEYVIIEKSAAMQAEQKQRLNINKVKWRTWDEIEAESLVGCFFSNELIDALPVHQVLVEDKQLKEIYVGCEDRKLVEKIGEFSSPKISKYFDLLGIDLRSDVYQEGYRSEVNLAALAWLDTVAKKMQRGYILTIDYGYSAERYYHPNRREGTLQCYYQHRRHNDPYWNIGMQDITAHVNFTALEKQGNLLGLENVGFTQQGLFLMALGLGDKLNELSTDRGLSISEVLTRREGLHSLIDPMGLGGFGVLVQSKGLNREEEGEQLRGLRIPR